ncbi:secretin N-terminal domain-containing protein [Bradyrhizobium genosp. P]|uniref:secretin N-terminal domain-containing protein n=1 Tax=Bradyrhizobium genosp. P TaxID=83641 RepID=UPI003CE6DE75
MSLNYINADIRQVVNDIMSNILAMPVIIDPAVSGTMTLVTSGKVPASDVPRLLDEALAKYGYGLSAVEQGVRVARLTDLSGGGRSGFEVIPLRYVNPADVINVIRPNVEESVHLAPAAKERGIAIDGPAGGVSSARELISVIDTDAMLHKSFALYTLSQANPAAVERELSFLFHQNASGATRVRFATLERLNGILVVADEPAALQQARHTIEKLDRPSEAAANIYVRPLKYRRATEVAQVLAQLVGAEPHAAVPPAQPAGEFEKTSDTGVAKRSGLVLNQPSPLDEQSPSITLTTQVVGGIPAVSLGLSAPVRIEADRSQNALVILAAPHDIKIIDAALRRLDVRPRQVLIQAIVAEVRLNDRLAYGVDYLLSSRDLGGVPKGGLSYVFPGTGVNAVLHALNAVADVKVVSAPRILALDNEPATIQVGDQVPVLSRSSQSTSSESSPIISSVELRDTGVILAVTPRIGTGGSLTLETLQEVSTANKNTLTNVQSPVISVRRLQSKVVTRDGDTIAIGGLMEDCTDQVASGIPALMDIPLLGPLFRSTERIKVRTELLVLLNPRVLESEAEASALTGELREKFESLAPDLAGQLGARSRRSTAPPRRGQAVEEPGWSATPAVAGPSFGPKPSPETLTARHSAIAR